MQIADIVYGHLIFFYELSSFSLYLNFMYMIHMKKSLADLLVLNFCVTKHNFLKSSLVGKIVLLTGAMNSVIPHFIDLSRKHFTFP